MPIFEYLCQDCGTKFEKLVRRSSDSENLVCPQCGEKHLTTELSTFAPKMGASKSASAPPCGQASCCPNAGMCGRG